MAKRGKIRSLAGKTRKAAADKAGISPNPMTNLVLADIALRVGGQILRHTVERGVIGTKYGPGKAKKIIKGRSMAQTLLSTAVARMATRSVPGAILVGGGMLAKTLFDRQRAKKAKAEGKQAVAKQIEDGE